MGKKKVSASEVRKELDAMRAKWGWSKSDIIAICKGGGSSAKGSSYERDFCRRLSLWWTGDARDDVFWRTSGSGARAKVRGKAGADTYGQHGDVAATDPVGGMLLDKFTIELKRGYAGTTIHDLVDKPSNGAVQGFERFLAQTIESARQARTKGWLLVTRRDRRVEMVWMPRDVYRDLEELGAWQDFAPEPLVILFDVVIHFERGAGAFDLVGMPLRDFFGGVGPEHIKTLWQRV